MKTDKKGIPLKKIKPADPTAIKRNGQGFALRNVEMFLLGVVIVITAIIYLPALNQRFTNWDDNDYVTENQYIRSLSPANLEYLFTRPIALNYHPLTMISLALNYKISGTDPYSYFLVNILLHLCNTLLVFFLALLVLDRNRSLALLVAAVFAVHPMHVESVAWISERKDVLYAFFFLAAMISWIWYAGKHRRHWYVVSLVLFLLAGLSKPSSVVLPLILLLLDFLFSRKFSLWLIVEKLPFFAISAGIGLATLYAQVGHSVVDIKQFNALQQFLFASYGFFIYLFKLAVPFGLSALHPVPVFNTSLDLPWIYFISPVIDVLIVGLVVYSLKFTRMLVFAVLFYFLNIALTLQFMQVGSAVIAERYTYVSYFGLLIGIAWLIGKAAGGRPILKPWLFLAAALYFGAMCFISVQRVKVWKNSESLWTDVIAKYPANHTAFNNRGYFYVKEGILDKALPDFTKSLELLPAFVDALNNRGSLYRLMDFPRPAIADYTKALAVNPSHVKALSGRGTAYATLGILDSALADLNKAYEIDPDLAATLSDRGSVYFRLGRFENAIEDCTRKIADDPGNTGAYLNRGISYSSLGKWDLAIHDYSFVISHHTDNPAVYEWRGVAYRSTGGLREAIGDFTQGIRMAPGKASLYVNRAMAYRQAGMGREAAADEEIARKLVAGVTE